MIKKEKIQTLLEQRIFPSEEFQDAQTYQLLLQYLVNASINGESPKESTIAIEVFNKHVPVDIHNSSTVRVYIHNLRKKLDSYYLNEGKDDTIRLTIPKGHYEVHFEKREIQSKRSRVKKSSVVLFISISLLLLSNLFWFIHNQNTVKVSARYTDLNNLVWQEFASSNFPIEIVLGDYFFLSKNQSDGLPIDYVRSAQINTPADLDYFIKKLNLPRQSFEESKHSFFGKYAPWSLFEILPPLVLAGESVILKISSELQWTDLLHHDIIFIGSFKTLRLLNNVVNNLHFTYQVKPTKLFFHGYKDQPPREYSVLKSSDTGHEIDYAIVAKVPGPNQNTIMIIISNHDIGTTSVTKYFTTPEKLEYFEENYLRHRAQSPTRYFETIFRVEGFNRTGTSTELLHFIPIDESFSFSRTAQQDSLE